MAKQIINIGSGELTGDGESLRSAFDKINDNFDEVYTGSGTTLSSDTTPSLGGNLDLSGNDITGIGNLNITGNITATGSISASVDYSNLTSTPTTLAGYGIADAYTKTEVDNAITSSVLPSGSTQSIDVVAADSTVLVDSVNGTLNATTLTGALPALDGSSLIDVAAVTSTTTVFTARADVNLTKGEVVYLTGISGNTPTIDKAQANSASTMPAFGIVKADVNANNNVEVITFGSCPGHDAADFGETGITFVLGDTVYVSATEAGKLTNVAPAGESNLIQNIGKIERATPTTNMTIKVGGAGRTNATPALDEGNIFIGDANNRATTASLATSIGSNIKTINGESLLGSGNITISGGSGGAAFTNIGIGADDSTIRSIGEGESFLILGGTGITTASDAEGNITITASGGGSGLQSRSTATGTTSSLADAAEEDLDITGFKSYALLAITTDRAARVRLYVSAATRTADASRAEGVDPTSDAGLIAEVITTGAETVIISPGAYGFNLESTPVTTIPCRVTNKSGSSSTVQVDLNILQLEA